MGKSEKEKLYEAGQEDFNRTKDNFLGPSKYRPWPKLFESNEEYMEKVEVYEKGWKNAADTDANN